jgi:hypothetical protein
MSKSKRKPVAAAKPKGRSKANGKGKGTSAAKPKPESTATTQSVEVPDSENAFRHLKGPKGRSQRRFLTSFCLCGTITHAAKAAGINRTLHNVWLRDPEYAECFAHAQEAAADYLEREAIRRATEGVKRYKFASNGKPLIHPETGLPYYEHEYSNALLIFLLKGSRPEKFRDKVLTINGHHEHRHVHYSLEELDLSEATRKLIEQAQAKLPSASLDELDLGADVLGQVLEAVRRRNLAQDVRLLPGPVVETTAEPTPAG